MWLQSSLTVFVFGLLLLCRLECSLFYHVLFAMSIFACWINCCCPTSLPIFNLNFVIVIVSYGQVGLFILFFNSRRAFSSKDNYFRYLSVVFRLVRALKVQCFETWMRNEMLHTFLSWGRRKECAKRKGEKLKFEDTSTICLFYRWFERRHGLIVVRTVTSFQFDNFTCWFKYLHFIFILKNGLLLILFSYLL